MPAPTIPDQLRRETISIRLPAWLVAEIRKAAGAGGIGNAVEVALIHSLKLKEPADTQ